MVRWFRQRALSLLRPVSPKGAQELDTEEWPEPGPGSVQYICGPLPEVTSDPYGDPGYPQQQLMLAKQNTNHWLNVSAGGMFPKTVGPQGFRYELLYGTGTGTDRLEEQYFRANVDPTERYVLTPPNTVHLRLDPADCGFTNLFPAGRLGKNLH